MLTRRSAVLRPGREEPIPRPSGPGRGDWSEGPRDQVRRGSRDRATFTPRHVTEAPLNLGAFCRGKGLGCLRPQSRVRDAEARGLPAGPVLRTRRWAGWVRALSKGRSPSAASRSSARSGLDLSSLACNVGSVLPEERGGARLAGGGVRWACTAERKAGSWRARPQFRELTVGPVLE